MSAKILCLGGPAHGKAVNDFGNTFVYPDETGQSLYRKVTMAARSDDNPVTGHVREVYAHGDMSSREAERALKDILLTDWVREGRAVGGSTGAGG